MSVRAKHNIYNQINENTLCDFFCKLTINENKNDNNNKNYNDSLDSIQGSNSYISDYISISSDTPSDSSYNDCKLIYSKTNYTFSIYNWSGLIKYLTSKEPYNY